MMIENIDIHKGNLLDIINDNSTGSIRGMQNPHIVSLSKFIFHDHHLESYKQLKTFYDKSKTPIDILTFYYGLGSIAFNTKIKNFELDKTLKSLKYKDRLFKNVLTNINLFIKKPNVKYLNKIKNDFYDESITPLSLVFCLRYCDLSIEDCFKYFPELDDIFINKNNKIFLKSNKAIDKFSNDNGLMLLSFISKYFEFLDTKTTYKLINLLFSKNIYDSFLLHRYLLTLLSNNENFHKFLEYFQKYIPFVDSKVVLGIAQYSLLDAFISDNYVYITGWYNQFTSKIKDGSLKYNPDGLLDYDLDDNIFEPVSYWKAQKNARFYINSIHILSFIFLKLKNDQVKTLNKKLSVNIFGGIHALSLGKIVNSNITTELSFHYTDLFSFSNNNFILNDKDKSLLKNNAKINLFIFDVESYLNKDIDKVLNDILKVLKKEISLKKVTISTTPLPPLFLKQHPNYSIMKSTIESFNKKLMHLISKNSFKVFDINDEISKISGINDNENYICNYIIKPELTTKLLEEYVNNSNE